MGGYSDNHYVGAAWIFTLSNGAWTQQGSKLLGSDASGSPQQGNYVALSSDGNTAIVGGPGDSGGVGAAWVYTRSNGVWTQQGTKLVGTGTVTPAAQGYSVALSADGNTAVTGGPSDNDGGVGAMWVFTRRGSVWSQEGSKLLGTGNVGTAEQGFSAALSADASTAIVGGNQDSFGGGAAWVFIQPALQVTPSTDVAASGPHGGPFSPLSFKYMLSASTGSVKYSITTPNWLTASPKSGTLTMSPRPVTIALNSAARNLTPNDYIGTASFIQTTNGAGNTSRNTRLTVNPKDYQLTVKASPASDGTVTGGGEIPEGSQTTVTATANSGFHFVQWTVAGKQVSTSSSYMFTMPSSAITVIADFQKN